MKKAFYLDDYSIFMMASLMPVVVMAAFEGLPDKDGGEVCKDECLYKCD